MNPALAGTQRSELNDPDLRSLLSAPENRCVLLDGSRDPNSGVTILVMLPGAAEPRLAVKVATTEQAATVIRSDAAMLHRLQDQSLSRVGRTVPRPAGMFTADGMLAAAASVVPGIPMSTGYHAYRHLSRRDRVKADFTAAAGWLAELHADTARQARPVTLLAGVPERIAARWPGVPAAQQLTQALGPLASTLSTAATPRTVVHGDFWAGNILLTAGAVTGVVDWAAGLLHGEPLRDVARFALSYALYLDRHTRPGRRVPGHPGLRADGWGAGIRYAVTGQHWFGDLVREFTGGALTRLGAPAGLWRQVLLAGLAEVAATADHPDFAARHRDLLLRLLAGARS